APNRACHQTCSLLQTHVFCSHSSVCVCVCIQAHTHSLMDTLVLQLCIQPHDPEGPGGPLQGSTRLRLAQTPHLAHHLPLPKHERCGGMQQRELWITRTAQAG
uniref:Uncharacterized protein n=1 Tax=Anas zonorhyncha TaxID=75864 RepID=A0A8B9UYA2_9AVES